MLPSGHEHSFICSLNFNVVAVLKINKKVHSQGVPFCKEKGEPIGMAAWLARPSTAWSLGSLGPWHFLLSTSSPDVATVSWSGLRLSSLNLDRFSGCRLLVWTSFFSLTFLSLNFLFWWSLSLHPVCACHLWILTAPLFLTAQEPTLFLADISFPTLFTPLLSSLLFSFCFLLSLVPYSLPDSLQLSTLHHLSTVFISTVLTPLLSSHLYLLHIAIL